MYQRVKTTMHCTNRSALRLEMFQDNAGTHYIDDTLKKLQ